MHNTGEFPRHVPAMSGLVLPVAPLSTAQLAARRQRVGAALSAGSAAVLVVVCMFLPLFTGTLALAGQELGMTVTSWGFEVDNGEPFGAMPTSGYVLVTAAVLLLAATVLCGMASVPWASRGTPKAAGLTTMAAAAFLAAAVWQIGMEVASFVESFRPIGALVDDDASIDSGPGAGLWLLVVAVVLALVALVTVLYSNRERAGARFRDDVPTPRHGFPVPLPTSPPVPPVPPLDAGYPPSSPYPAPPQRPPSPWAPQRAQRHSEPAVPQGVEPRSELGGPQGAHPQSEPGGPQGAQPQSEPGSRSARPDPQRHQAE